MQIVAITETFTAQWSLCSKRDSFTAGLCHQAAPRNKFQLCPMFRIGPLNGNCQKQNGGTEIITLGFHFENICTQFINSLIDETRPIPLSKYYNQINVWRINLLKQLFMRLVNEEQGSLALGKPQGPHWKEQELQCYSWKPDQHRAGSSLLIHLALQKEILAWRWICAFLLKERTCSC